MSNLSVLLPYQKNWISDLSQVKVWEKSRRIGASWCEAFDNVCIAAKEGGQNVWYISANKDMALEYIHDAAHWARHFQTACSEFEEFLFEDNSPDGKRSIQAYRIKFASGKRITALSSRPTNLRGKQGVVVIDEASFHEDLQGLIKAAMALLMWGGRVRILSTHNGEDNPFNEIIKEILAGKKPYSLHRTTLDDALEQGLFRRICLVTKQEYNKAAELDWRQNLVDFYGDHADEELFCVPTNSQGAYFSRVMVERCMSSEIPVINLTLKDSFLELSESERKRETQQWLKENIDPHLALLHPKYKSSFGFDFGRSGDLSYLVPLQEMPNLVRKPPFALEMRNVPYYQQKQILFHIIQKLPRFQAGFMDATGNGAALSEDCASRFGRHRIEELKMTQDWYRENMPKYKAALEDRKILLPADSNIIDDHRMIAVDKGIPKPLNKRTGKGIRQEQGQRHADSAISLCLAWQASCADKLVTSPAFGSVSFSEYDTWSV
ncbi:MAG: terminase large subunit domain-containing protein [Waterburya sp.]